MSLPIFIIYFCVNLSIWNDQSNQRDCLTDHYTVRIGEIGHRELQGVRGDRGNHNTQTNSLTTSVIPGHACHTKTYIYVIPRHIYMSYQNTYHTQGICHTQTPLLLDNQTSVIVGLYISARHFSFQEICATWLPGVK